jgi:hypothetical protein
MDSPELPKLNFKQKFKIYQESLPANPFDPDYSYPETNDTDADAAMDRFINEDNEIVKSRENKENEHSSQKYQYADISGDDKSEKFSKMLKGEVVKLHLPLEKTESENLSTEASS